MKKIRLIGCSVLVSLLFAGCPDSFVETQPELAIDGSLQIIDGPSAQNALNGLYNDMQSGNLNAGNLGYLMSLFTDETIHTGSFPTFAQVAGNNIQFNNVNIGNIYASSYGSIFAANRLINIVPTLEGVDPVITNSILGQALGVRAFVYFNLVNIFGGVPLELAGFADSVGIDNNPISRSSAAEVYAQIEADLEASIAAFNASGATPPVINFNLNAALMLQGKVALQQGNFADAVAPLEAVVNNSGASLVPFEALFGEVGGNGLNSLNAETIWSLPFGPTDGSGLAFFFFQQGRRELAPSAALQLAFEPGDLRAGAVGNGPAGIETQKYTRVGDGDDDLYIFRYADALLSLAEAYLATGNTTGALDLVNQVRTRAGLADLAAVDVDAILQERFVELFNEGGGDRMLSLVRYDMLTEVVLTKPGNGVDEATLDARGDLFPIPQAAIINNPGGLTQNPGY